MEKINTPFTANKVVNLFPATSVKEKNSADEKIMFIQKPATTLVVGSFKEREIIISDAEPPITDIEEVKDEDVEVIVDTITETTEPTEPTTKPEVIDSIVTEYEQPPTEPTENILPSTISESEEVKVETKQKNYITIALVCVLGVALYFFVFKK